MGRQLNFPRNVLRDLLIEVSVSKFYSARLDELKVVDPACGSGAFLIQAFNYLYRERQWIANELERLKGTRSLFDTHVAMRDVLAKNLYGVDINSESVELTRLALWLHTALPDREFRSLSSLYRTGYRVVKLTGEDGLHCPQCLDGERIWQRTEKENQTNAAPGSMGGF